MGEEKFPSQQRVALDVFCSAPARVNQEPDGPSTGQEYGRLRGRVD